MAEVLRLLSAGGKRPGEETLPAGEPDRDFYTPSEAARLLQAPLRSILEWLDTGEVEVELDPLNGRWKIRKASLKGFESVRQTEEELAWRYEKKRLLAELHAERERADQERDRADRERGRADREREQAERLRRELEIDRMKGSRWGGEGWLIGRKKTLEEKIAAAIRAEFVSLVTGFEEERREYHRRSVLKEEAQVALKDAETEVRRLHSERVALGKRFWEAYYGEGEVSFSRFEIESGALGRTIERAEKALKKARVGFEEADFDEAAESSRLREKADAAQGEAERRIAALEEALGDALAGARRSVDEARQALYDELETPRPGIAGERNAGGGDAEPRQVGNGAPRDAAMPQTTRPRRPWWLRWLGV